VGKHGGKRPMGRSRRKWENNIKMYIQEVRCGDVNWIEVAQDLAGTCEYGNEHSGCIKCGEFLD
jgi:hypothetical protein